MSRERELWMTLRVSMWCGAIILAAKLVSDIGWNYWMGQLELLLKTIRHGALNS